MSLNAAVPYRIYRMSGLVEEHSRCTKFTLDELQTLVGGKIQIVPAAQQGYCYVVNEVGFYCMGQNPSLCSFYGTVVETHLTLIR